MTDPIIFQMTLSQFEAIAEYSAYVAVGFAWGVIGLISLDILRGRVKHERL